MHNFRAPQVLAATLIALAPLSAHAQASRYFRVQVVDEATNRGVPLVELATTSNSRFITDSNGLAAIDAPELMNQKVYFSVSSHGYEHPADMFGSRGEALDVKAGGSAQIKIRRLNIAERLYRITGAGIYRDSVLTEQKVPIKQPLLNGKVTGQDTVMVTPYKGKLYWFFGDTNKPSYPLGNFATSGATSLLPGAGGLDPSVGVDLTYWTDSEGFSKKMIPLEPALGGPIWVGGTFSIRDAAGQERLFTRYVHLKSGGASGENGLALFNDDKAVFEKKLAFSTPLFPDGHPFHAMVNGREYLYFQTGNSSEAAPLMRLRADMEHVTNPASYECFTCLAPGSRPDKSASVERDAQGKPIYAWKPNTAAPGPDLRKELIAGGKMKAEEALIQLREVETDAPIQSHGGSVFWNAFRRRWVMISGQAGGSPSYLGELWFSEADTPVGPWVYARKIITHNKYTFYNPTQHPFFDQDGGRLIYFEGTYTSTYSGTEDKTPLYDYNQIMYRLALDDPRLALPEPVYELKNSASPYKMRPQVEASRAWAQVASIPFFAVPPESKHEGLVPVYAVPFRQGARLQLERPAQAQPLFYALPSAVAAGEKTSPGVVPLYEYRNAQNRTLYSTQAEPPAPGMTRQPAPLCRVWRNPSSVLALDAEAKPL